MAILANCTPSKPKTLSTIPFILTIRANTIVRVATPLVKCEYFDVKREIVEGESTIDASADSFMIVMCLEGAATITDNFGGVTEVKKGESILVPAVITSMKAVGNATFMTATV